MIREIRFAMVIILLSILMSSCHHLGRYHGPKPFMCKVVITYEGKDYIGRNEGQTLQKATKEAVEEGCERACDEGDDECELKCRREAVTVFRKCRDRSTGDHFEEGKEP